MAREKKTVLVSGASTGIGRATVRRLAARGHRVLAGVRKEEDAESIREDARGLVGAGELDGVVGRLPPFGAALALPAPRHGPCRGITPLATAPNTSS